MIITYLGLLLSLNALSVPFKPQQGQVNTHEMWNNKDCAQHAPGSRSVGSALTFTPGLC